MNVGDKVEVYCKFCPWSTQAKYMVIDSIVSGTHFPRIGKTDGWVDATIVDKADDDPKNFVSPAVPERSAEGPFVKIQFADKLWADKSGNILGQKSLFQWLPLSAVRAKKNTSLKPTKILVVRWGGQIPIDENRFDFALSDQLIQSLMETIHSEIENIDITTVWVSNSFDLTKVGNFFVGNKFHYGMYFLWGSNHDQKPGYVLSADLLALMRRMESHGTVTKYPNHADLYALLTSKIYQPLLSTNSALSIPPTVMIPVSRFWHSPTTALGQCFENINDFEGVVKVGGSWMGDGVRAFRGVCDFIAKSQSLLEQGGIIDSLIVQKKISVLCEPRIFLFNGEIKNIRYTWNEKTDPVSGRIHALRTCPQDRAAKELFEGIITVQESVEARMTELVNEWKNWLVTVTGETPVFVRIDFLVDKEFNVWTCELGEMGSSMVGFREGKDLLFRAIAKSMKPSRPTRPAPIIDS